MAALSDGGDLLSQFEKVLHQAATETPDVGKALRLRHAASACAQSMLYEGADAAEYVRALYGKATGGVMGPESVAPALTRGGEPVEWVWETETYEKASEAAAIGAAAYAARKAREQEAADLVAWEEKKKTMSKRERKKAEEKEKKEAEAKAAEAAIQAESDAKAAEEAAAAEAKRLADPAVQKELAYQKQLQDSIQAVLEAGLERFLQRAHALDTEPRM